MVSNPGIGSDICIDQFDNSFSCGQIIGTSTIGNYTFTSWGAQDVVVQKKDPAGMLLWAIQIGGAQSDFVHKMTYDGIGNIWITGQFNGTMNVGNFTLVSAGGTDAFLVKINASNGQVVFAERGGGTGNVVGMSVQEDAQGNVFFTGTFYGNFSYGSVNLNSQGTMDVFHLKIDNNGSPIWGNTIGGTATETMWSMTSDAVGNTYVAGFSTSPIIYFSGTPINNPSTARFITKFDNLGNYVWSTSSLFAGEIMDLCTDVAGNIYFTGNFDTQAVFGSFTLTGAGNDDILLGKINNSGTFEWVHSFGGTGSDQGYGIDCTPQGEVFMVGTFQGNMMFGNTPLSGGKSYLTKFNSAGVASWSIQTVGNASSHISKSIVVNPTGDLYFLGAGDGTLSMGSVSGTLNGGYLVKLADNANRIQGTVFLDINNNGVLDAGENGIPNAILALNATNSWTASNNLGTYQMYTHAGNQSVGMPNIPLYHTLTTSATHTSNFSGMGNMDLGKDFGLYPTPNVTDLLVDITPVSHPKAGRVLAYLITYKNIGTIAIDASVTLEASLTI